LSFLFERRHSNFSNAVIPFFKRRHSEAPRFLQRGEESRAQYFEPHHSGSSTTHQLQHRDPYQLLHRDPYQDMASAIS